MSGHLPECDYERQDYRGNDNRVCYCSRLRACEQRIYSRDIFMDAWMKGRANGIDAAEAAVAEIHKPVQEGRLTSCEGCMANSGWEYPTAYPCETVTAIRALKEKP